MKKTAGQKAQKALEDSTKYDPWEVAYGMVEDMGEQLIEAAKNYEAHIDQDEFCVIYINAADPLIPNVIRRKYYCWPWLPSPRPDQGVFLYNKAKQKITKRLWILPPPHTMAQLTSCGIVGMAKPYKNMRDWSNAFYNGTFWDFIRKQHDIKMLSQEEFFKQQEFLEEKLFKNQKEELIRKEDSEPGFDFGDPRLPQSFDFSKITTNQVANPT